MSPFIEVRSLSKHFGSVIAVDDVSFSVDKGEVLGFLGPNGAGKSTCGRHRLLPAAMAPPSSAATTSGRTARGQTASATCRGFAAYGDMTPEGFLDFVARVRGMPRSAQARHRQRHRRMGLGSAAPADRDPVKNSGGASASPSHPARPRRAHLTSKPTALTPIRSTTRS
jgi:ABC-type multidrug transport system ATPase subunit